MRRTDRLFEIIQLFRNGKLWKAQDIAERLVVSVRTIYRDVETLILSGVPIEGERGIGYMLREPVFLPPLTLTTAEYEALQFGMALAARHVDQGTATSIQSLIGKINAVLPQRLVGDNPGSVFAVYGSSNAKALRWLTNLRFAVQNRRFVAMTYTSLDGETSTRHIRPLQIEFWGAVWTCTTWCDLRNDFRVFRLDLIADCHVLEEQFPQDKEKSLKTFLQKNAGRDSHDSPIVLGHVQNQKSQRKRAHGENGADGEDDVEAVPGDEEANERRCHEAVDIGTGKGEAHGAGALRGCQATNERKQDGRQKRKACADHRIGKH
jgi:predicted DNA-binding transcriptional regulator YafY